MFVYFSYFWSKKRSCFYLYLKSIWRKICFFRKRKQILPWLTTAKVTIRTKKKIPVQKYNTKFFFFSMVQIICHWSNTPTTTTKQTNSAPQIIHPFFSVAEHLQTKKKRKNFVQFKKHQNDFHFFIFFSFFWQETIKSNVCYGDSMIQWWWLSIQKNQIESFVIQIIHNLSILIDLLIFFFFLHFIDRFIIGMHHVFTVNFLFQQKIQKKNWQF